ncbi:GATA transcription factor 18 [Rosa sericea]
MQRCSSTSSQGHVMGSCSCGLFHTQSNSSFSMLFSMPNNHHKAYDQYEPSDHHHMYSFASPSSVDCTLSLGTPSTRLTAEDGNDDKRGGRHERRSVSNFCWDLLQPKHATSAPKNGSGNRGGAGNNDSLLARRCANCDTTSTPLWRNGPRGPKVNEMNLRLYPCSGVMIAANRQVKATMIDFVYQVLKRRYRLFLFSI